jgi:hypothetical protein
MMKSILTVLFLGAAIASAVTVEAQEVPGCRNAWNDLDMRGALGDARTLIATDCPVMYREGWLANPNKRTTYVIPSCLAAWNALDSKGGINVCAVPADAQLSCYSTQRLAFLAISKILGAE